jgi:hypothetical protein
MSIAYVAVPYSVLHLNLKLSSVKLSYLSTSGRAYGALMFLFERKRRDVGEGSMDLFYFLNTL